MLTDDVELHIGVFTDDVGVFTDDVGVFTDDLVTSS
jgi:hypothetical protein